MNIVDPAPPKSKTLVVGQAINFLVTVCGKDQTGIAELRLRNPEAAPRSRPQTRFQSLPFESHEDYEEFAHLVMNRVASVGAAPRILSKSKNGKKARSFVRSVNCVWATVNHAGSTGALAVARTMNALVLRPTLIVETSWRQQIYYSIGKSLAGSSGLVAWEKLMLKLRSHLMDRASVALEDFVTLPGSLVPSGDNVFERAVTSPDSSYTVYSFEEIEDAFNRLPPAPAASRSVGRASATNIRELSEASRAKPFESTNGEAFGQKPAIRRRTSFAERGVNPSEADLPPGYELADDDSVWHVVAAASAHKEPKRTFVSFAPLRISQIRENSETGQIKIVLAYSYLGRRRNVTVTRAQMCNARQLAQILAAAGAPVSSNNARQTVAYLSAYEQAFTETIPRKTMIDRFGRGNVGATEFFLPGLSANSEFEPRNSGDAQLFDAFAARSGSLAEWVRNVNILADEALIVPQIAVLAAFVPPLQKMLQIPNFILDLHGATSTGKSTALRLAASVFGKPRDPGSLVMQWMNTKTAIEQVAGICSELPIFLDDAQHCPSRLVGSVVYMIANGKGATRAIGGAGGIRDAASWHTIALSTSETPLREIARHEGAQSRILPLGGETPPFPFGSAALVGRLDRAAAENYGYAGEAYIRHLNGWSGSDWLKRRQRYLQIQTGLAFDFKTNLLGRVAAYVAAVQIAAEIAAPLLGLRFDPESIASWLALKLEENEQTQNVVFAALRLLADYYSANPTAFAGASEFSLNSQSEIKGAVRLQHYVGFTRPLFAQIFDGRRWNSNIILAKLAAAGVLLATEKNRFTKKISIGNHSYRMICVKWSSLF